MLFVLFLFLLSRKGRFVFMKHFFLFSCQDSECVCVCVCVESNFKRLILIVVYKEINIKDVWD